MSAFVKSSSECPPSLYEIGSPSKLFYGRGEFLCVSQVGYGDASALSCKKFGYTDTAAEQPQSHHRYLFVFEFILHGMNFISIFKAFNEINRNS